MDGETSNLKTQVRDTYNTIAPEYEKWALERTGLRISHVEKLLEHLTSQSHVLELGCGAGLPVTQLLASRTRVTANDISEAMIVLARKRVLDVDYRCCDMMTLDFPAESFDAVVAMYSVIHLPHEEQKLILNKAHVWLKKAGLLLLNLGASHDPGSWGDWFGSQMFWSSFDTQANIDMVTEAGFKVQWAEAIVEPTEDPDDPDHGVSFTWIRAKKRLNSKNGFVRIIPNSFVCSSSLKVDGGRYA